MKKLLATLALALSFAAAPVMAAENPFSMGNTAQIQTATAADGKCGDSMKKEAGKCGDSKKAEDAKAMKECMDKKTKEECAKEGKCGEGKCGEGMKKK